MKASAEWIWSHLRLDDRVVLRNGNRGKRVNLTIVEILWNGKSIPERLWGRTSDGEKRCFLPVDIVEVEW